VVAVAMMMVAVVVVSVAVVMMVMVAVMAVTATVHEECVVRRRDARQSATPLARPGVGRLDGARKQQHGRGRRG
jgi:hypothetical protein